MGEISVGRCGRLGIPTAGGGRCRRRCTVCLGLLHVSATMAVSVWIGKDGDDQYKGEDVSGHVPLLWQGLGLI